MRGNSEAAAAARSEPVEAANPAAEARPQPKRWSIPRMLAVSAAISVALWALIIVAVMVLVN
jgi:hypothetical protein